ncbi:hypothetical protein M9458_021927, partial [Cirrhinus mrigala]
MVLLTLSKSWSSSRRGTRHEGSTTSVGDAISCPWPEKGDPSTVEWAMALLLRAASALETKSASSRGGH